MTPTVSTGSSSGSFQTRVARRGEVLRGEWGMWGGGSGSYVEDTVAFGKTIPVPIPLARITVLDEGDPFTTECPAAGRVVPRGWLCVYTTTQISVTGVNSYNATDGQDPTSKVGFGLWGDCTSSACVQYGSWVARVGSASDVGARPRSGKRQNP